MSPRTLRTVRQLDTETVSLERFAGLDGQGLPSYDSPVEFTANVLEVDAAEFSRGAQFVISSDGTRIRTPLTLYVAGDEDEVPDEQDRVELSDGRTFIVMERGTWRALRRPRSETGHVRLRCKAE